MLLTHGVIVALALVLSLSILSVWLFRSQVPAPLKRHPILSGASAREPFGRLVPELLR